MTIFFEFSPVHHHASKYEFYRDTCLPKPIITGMQCECIRTFDDSPWTDSNNTPVTSLVQCLASIFVRWQNFVKEDPVIVTYFDYTRRVICQVLPNHCIFAVQTTLDYLPHEEIPSEYPWLPCYNDKCAPVFEYNCKCTCFSETPSIHKLQDFVEALNTYEDIDWYLSYYAVFYGSSNIRRFLENLKPEYQDTVSSTGKIVITPWIWKVPVYKKEPRPRIQPTWVRNYLRIIKGWSSS